MSGAPDEPRAAAPAAADTPTAEFAGPYEPPYQAAAREAATIPETIGAYRISHVLGQGGMGVVYLGVREGDQFTRRVAIKLLKRGMDTESVLRRFELERQVLAALTHVGIARLYDAGETDEGLPYFVMEYVEGQCIDEYCDAHHLRLEERLRLFRKVCEAVQYAHQNLIIHRDLKPSNIVVTTEGEPKLMDFGIAKLVNPNLASRVGTPTLPDQRIMTPEYASPEQVRGGPITTSSDVYSLGVLLYVLLTGHAPYRIETIAQLEIERVVCDQEPERPSTAISKVEHVPVADRPETRAITPDTVSKLRESRPDRLRRALSGDLDNIVMMAMRKEPQRRYASAEQLSEDIRRYLEERTVIARPATIRYRTSKFVKRNRLGVSAAALIVLLLVGGVVGTTLQWRRAEGETRAADLARAAAVEQKAIAVAHREQGIKMIQTLLSDVHDEIAQLDGSMHARSVLAETAHEQLLALAEWAEEDPTLNRYLATAYDRFGDLQGGTRNPSLGDAVGAQESHEIAMNIRERLAEESPDDPELRKELSTSYLKIGDALRQQGDGHGALAYWNKALDVREALLAAEPESVARQRDVAVALASVGQGKIELGDSAAGLADYDRSLAIRRRLVAEQPDAPVLRRDLAVMCVRVGYYVGAGGDEQASLALLEEALAIRTDLARSNPNNSRWRRDEALTRYYVGHALLALGRPGEARPHFEDYLAVCNQRSVMNPSSARARSDVANAHEGMGTIHAALGDWPAALASYESFRDTIVPLSERHPDNARYRRMVALAHEGIAEACDGGGASERALESASTALSVAQDLAVAAPDDAGAQKDVARLLLGLGRLEQQAGLTAPALRRLEDARALYATLLEAEPHQVALQEGLGESLRLLSRAMVKLQDPAEALRYAQEAMDLAPEPSPALLRDLAAAHDLAGHRDQAAVIAADALRRLEEAPAPGDEALLAALRDDLARYRGN